MEVPLRIADEELRRKASQLEAQAAKLGEGAAALAHSWSGSSLGYHAELYYGDFEKPPIERRFSPEWGGIHGVPPGYRARGENEVKTRIEELAGTRFDAIESSTQEILDQAKHIQEEIVVALAALRDNVGFDAEKVLLGEIENYQFGSSRGEYIQANWRRGGVTRDITAFSQGTVLPAHVFYAGVAYECESRCAAVREFLDTARRLIRRVQARTAQDRAAKTAPAPSNASRRVFIGHGRSQVWRELKDFLDDTLKLAWDEFDRDPTAGLSTKERLEQMLNDCSFAFLIMTAEDEHRDGTSHARENVIHEAGLFQGKLGFTRAIVILEEGCEEFSNIRGVGQLRFPPGRIDAVFEAVRKVLRREGVLSPD